ncbi:MAG: 50S ribosomal protein L4 [bacterium]
MSREINVYNLSGEEVGSFSFPEIDPNRHAIYYGVKVHLANMSPKTASTRTRSMVRGGGRKPWRQKGTGRARHGSIRSPIWKGGGVVFGPHPREVRLALPKKVRRLGFISAIVDKIKANQLILVSDFNIDEPKTKKVVGILDNLGIISNCLIIIDNLDSNFVLGARNIPYVTVKEPQEVSIFDIMRYTYILTTPFILEGLKGKVKADV